MSPRDRIVRAPDAGGSYPRVVLPLDKTLAGYYTKYLERERLCAVLNCPVNAVFTTAEIAREVAALGYCGPWA